MIVFIIPFVLIIKGEWKQSFENSIEGKVTRWVSDMIRFGIIGTSVITEKFLNVTLGIREFTLTAVYSRDLKRAEEFGSRYGASCFYDNLDEFAKSDAFDAVYIASPNCCHCEQAVLMLQNKKHVLCEKPLASNVREAEAMFQAAHENGVVLLEAMRSVFAPEFLHIRNYMKKVGSIRRVSFCYNKYSSRYNRYKKGIVENAFNPELSNGALMDLGCYCIYPMVFLFGLPRQVTGMCARLSNGIDGAGTVLMQYGDMIGEARYSKVNYSVVESEIQGEEATMLISGIASTKDLTIRYNNGFKEVVHFEQQDNNMEYEIRAFIGMIKGERSPQVYETASMNTAVVMEEARKQMGIHFPADKAEDKLITEKIVEKKEAAAKPSGRKKQRKKQTAAVKQKKEEKKKNISRKEAEAQKEATQPEKEVKEEQAVSVIKGQAESQEG